MAGESLAPTALPDVVEKSVAVELTGMNRVGSEYLEEEFIRIFTVQPGSERAQLDEHLKELTAKHHGGHVNAWTALLRHQSRFDSNRSGTFYALA